MSIVFHDDPFTPFDRQPKSGETPGSVPGFRRSVAIPDSYLPVAVDAARLRVGARPLESRQWVSAVDDDWGPTREMKLMLLHERPGEVVSCLDGAEETCDEVAAGVFASTSAPR